MREGVHIPKMFIDILLDEVILLHWYLLFIDIIRCLEFMYCTVNPTSTTII